MATENKAPSGVTGMIRPLSTAERVTGLGCLVLLVSMPFSWKSFHGYASVNGFHGWGLATLLIALAASALLVARSPYFRNTVTLPRLPLTDSVAFIVAGIAELVTILLFASQYGSGRGTELGFYLALVGAVLTGAGGWLALRKARAPVAPGTAAEPAEAAEAAPPEISGGGLPTARGGGPPEPPA